MMSDYDEGHNLSDNQDQECMMNSVMGQMLMAALGNIAAQQVERILNHESTSHILSVLTDISTSYIGSRCFCPSPEPMCHWIYQVEEQEVHHEPRADCIEMEHWT